MRFPMPALWRWQSIFLGAVLLENLVAGSEELTRRADGAFQPWSAVDQNLCAMYDGRVALVGGQIFMMNGNYSFVESPTSEYKSNLFTISLNKSLDVNGLISRDRIYSIPVPSGAPWNSEAGVFFFDNTTLFLYAGMPHSNTTETDHLWAYNVSNSLWEDVTVSGGNFQHGHRLGGQYNSIPGSGMSFFSGDETGILPGILRFDSSNASQLSWKNETTFSYDKINSPGPMRFGAELAFVPVGDQGVLISIGGSNTTRKGDQHGSSYSWDDILLTSVDIYDIASSQWYNVPTSGDIPSHRGEFCHWVTPAPDRSSYSITIYGGWSLTAGQSYEDIYILSVPSFRWIKMTDSNNIEKTSGGTKLGRSRQHCVKWREDRGFVIGGYIKNGTDEVNLVSCNPLYPPIRLLNLTSYEWLDAHDPDANSTYEVNSQIYNVIGGSATGGATSTSPSGGWGPAALQSIFSKQNNFPVAPTNLFAKDETEPAASSSAASSSSSSSTPGSVIAGAVVGSVVGATLLISGAHLLFLRKRKLQQIERERQNNDHSGGIAGPLEAKHGQPSELETSHATARYEADAGDTGPFELHDTARTELGDSSVVHEADSKQVGLEKEQVTR